MEEFAGFLIVLGVVGFILLCFVAMIIYMLVKAPIRLLQLPLMLFKPMAMIGAWILGVYLMANEYEWAWFFLVIISGIIFYGWSTEKSEK